MCIVSCEAEYYVVLFFFCQTVDFTKASVYFKVSFDSHLSYDLFSPFTVLDSFCSFCSSAVLEVTGNSKQLNSKRQIAVSVAAASEGPGSLLWEGLFCSLAV